jgi:predicted rRNA methylase YqxC with S4 and FtsJ domains
LQHGAALVYAVEVGHGQLVGRLRADPRVRNSHSPKRFRWPPLCWQPRGRC